MSVFKLQSFALRIFVCPVMFLLSRLPSPVPERYFSVPPVLSCFRETHNDAVVPLCAVTCQQVSVLLQLVSTFKQPNLLLYFYPSDNSTFRRAILCISVAIAGMQCLSVCLSST